MSPIAWIVGIAIAAVVVIVLLLATGSRSDAQYVERY